MEKRPDAGNQGLLLVGMDHNHLGLTPKAIEIIKKFGVKGKTLFIEGSSRSSDPKHFSEPFPSAAREAEAMGMNVVRLDSGRIGKMRNPLFERKKEMDKKPKGAESKQFYREFSHVAYHLRERRWIRAIKKSARAGDIVLVHQNHLASMQPELSDLGLRRSFLFVSEPIPSWVLSLNEVHPLSPKELKALKSARAARRPINRRRVK